MATEGLVGGVSVKCEVDSSYWGPGPKSPQRAPGIFHLAAASPYLTLDTAQKYRHRRLSSSSTNSTVAYSIANTSNSTPRRRGGGGEALSAPRTMPSSPQNMSGTPNRTPGTPHRIAVVPQFTPETSNRKPGSRHRIMAPPHCMPGTTNHTPRTPDRTLTFPQNTSGTPHRTPGTPHRTPGTPHRTPGTPHRNSSTSQYKPGTPNRTPGTPHRILPTTQYNPGTPNRTPGTPHRTLATPQHTPRAPHRTPGTPHRTPHRTPNTPHHTPNTPHRLPNARRSSSPYATSSADHSECPYWPYSAPGTPYGAPDSPDWDNQDPGYTLPRGSHPIIPMECLVLDSLERSGSDPLMQTARGKLQTQRSKLNNQINREVRLRAGAENLYKATTNRKLRDKVALELSYINFNLQLLKEELADLNSSVLIYQSDSAIISVPMLPLGLKETKEMDFKPVFKDYICSHYHDDGESYDSELQALNDIRQACRTPIRNETGIQLLYEYYNHLYFVEKRFFPPDRSLGLYFEWYDSLTGVPSAQRTVGFEKGSTLFNIAALYTQIGARQDRMTLDGVEKAVDCFQRAAGAFQYLQDNFSHAPSMDLQPHTLTMLIQIMLSQAQEVLMERAMLEKPPSNIQSYLQAAQEAAKVSEMYAMCHAVMREDPIRDYAPPSWVSMAEVKSQYFTSLAHHHTATAIIQLKDPEVNDLRQHFEKVHIGMNGTPSHSMSTAIETFCDRKTLGKAHLRQSILCLEDAMSLHSHSKQLRRIDTFQAILRSAHNESLSQFAALEEEDDFSELMEAPPIRPHTVHTLNAMQPDFAKYKVDDLMRRLGLLAIFSARHSWTAPRELVLRRDVGQDYGFSVRGDSPVIIAMVEGNSLASKSGMKIGDFMVAVGDRDVKWCKHDEVVQFIRLAGLTLRLRVVSPIDRNYLDPSSGSCAHTSEESLSRRREAEGEREMGLKQMPGKAEAEKTGSAWTLRRKGGSKEQQSKNLTNGDR